MKRKDVSHKEKALQDPAEFNKNIQELELSLLDFFF